MLTGIGPVPAIQKLLQRTGLSLNQIDLFDVNEAFAPQWLGVQRELDIDPEKCNINGGAIALGHRKYIIINMYTYIIYIYYILCLHIFIYSFIFVIALGASGARILTNLTYELVRSKSTLRPIKYAIGGACIGGGQGVAVLLENC